MGPVSLIHAHSLWASLCPEKLVNENKRKISDGLLPNYLITNAATSPKPRCRNAIKSFLFMLNTCLVARPGT